MNENNLANEKTNILKKKPKAYVGDEPYIFISYSHSPGDLEYVFADLDKLEAEKFRFWYDDAVATGEKWPDAISDRLNKSSFTLFFLSEKAIGSQWVAKEIKQTEKLNAKKDTNNWVSIYLDKSVYNNVLITEGIGQQQGINRYALNEEDYYERLIGALPPITRRPPTKYDNDVKRLDLCALPTPDDIAEGRKKIDPKIKQERQLIKIKEYVEKDVNSYEIDNVFQITSRQSAANKNLWDLAPEWVGTSATNLLSFPIDIKIGYVSPMRLLTGIITELEDNWPPIVDAYTTLAGATMDNLDDFHFYVEFCWLSWGPSVDTTFLLENEKEKFMVAQICCGDEANSIPLIVEKDTWKKEFDGLKIERKSGWPLSLKGLSVVNPKKDPYFEPIYKHPLFKGLFEESIAFYFIPQKSSISAICRYDEPFYSTAYVWLMLEQARIQSGNNVNLKDREYEKGLEPGKVIPFFEHANLASKYGFNFLLGCLARKVIQHVLECEKSENENFRNGGVYRYATALFEKDTLCALDREIKNLKPDDQEIVKKRLVRPNREKNEKGPRSSLDVLHFVNALHDKVLPWRKE